MHCMQKKLSITINELEASYELMARDEARESEAFEWLEGTLWEITDEENVRPILAHYERQSEEDAVAEDEAAFKDHNETIKVEKDG